MNRPKMLPPTLRGRRRYLAFKVISDGNIQFLDLSNAIWHSTLNLLGELGASEADIWVPRTLYEEGEKIGLVRCKHTMVEQVRTALSLIERVGDVKVNIMALGVSGTIRAAKQKFFGERTLKDYT